MKTHLQMKILFILWFSLEILELVAQFIALLVGWHWLFNHIHDEFLTHFQLRDHLLPNFVELWTVNNTQCNEIFEWNLFFEFTRIEWNATKSIKITQLSKWKCKQFWKMKIRKCILPTNQVEFCWFDGNYKVYRIHLRWMHCGKLSMEKWFNLMMRKHLTNTFCNRTWPKFIKRFHLNSVWTELNFK